MEIHYKYKSAKDYDSVPMDGHFMSVGVLKEKIFESKQYGRGKDFDIIVSNAQTEEEYLDEEMLIPKGTRVLIRRVPGRATMKISTEEKPKFEEPQLEQSKFPDVDSSTINYVSISVIFCSNFGFHHPDDSEWDEFGSDLYAIPEALPVPRSDPVPDVLPASTGDEQSKLKALIDTPALDWQRQGPDGFGAGRGFGRGNGGRMNGRGFGFQQKTPPPGYICHRCKVPGHFIQHCPTNGDPNYDVKRMKPPTGIPKSMLMATPDGSYALPSGAGAVMKPNEAAFEKEIEGMPSTTRSVGDLPPELHCPLCKEVMKDAVLTSIRDYIISKGICVCGATNVLADDLLPNKTLRDTINRILESGNSSAENAGSMYQVQDMDSARFPQTKIPSPTASAASRGDQKPVIEKTLTIKEELVEEKTVPVPPQVLEQVNTVKVPDVSEATSMSTKEPVSQGGAPLAEDEVQQRIAAIEAGKKKKKKKVRAPTNDMQWMNPQEYPADNYMMPMGPTGFNPYWSGMQPGMDYMPPYGGPMMPFPGGYGGPPGPFDMPFGVMPPDPFAAQGFMFPMVPPPHRDLSELGMGMHARPPPVLSRAEFEARKADLRRKHDHDRRAERDFPRDREFNREAGNFADGPPMKSKSKTLPQSSRVEHDQHHRPRIERPSPEPQLQARPPKRKSHERERDHHHHARDSYDDRDYEREQRHRHRSSRSKVAEDDSPSKPASSTAAMDQDKKSSVFARISFPEAEAAKKSKLSSSSQTKTNGYSETYKKSAATEYGSSEDDDGDDRHFKRKKTARHDEASPPARKPKWEDDHPRHSKSSRDRNRDYEYERGYSKHR
ncbi:hypothetical protein ACFE04_013170 [Oxalis oulophora]